MDELEITKALAEDLEAILQLQYLAFRSEAEMLGDFSIPPMRQTPAEIGAEFGRGVMLKAVEPDGEIVGSVRGYCAEGTGFIGKLIVRPDRQGRGVGRRLLEAAEEALATERYELFTSRHSIRNLAMYERAGYVRFREEELPSGVRLVYLEKHTLRR